MCISNQDAGASLAEKAFQILLTLRSSVESEEDEVVFCDQSALDSFKAALDGAIQRDGTDLHEQLETLATLSHARMTEVYHSQVQPCWRRLYTDAMLALVAVMILQQSQYSRISSDAPWRNWIRRLDMIVIIAGAPGEDRHELVLELIYLVQQEYAPTFPNDIPRPTILWDLRPSDPPRSALFVTRLSQVPSLASFGGLASTPFIVPGWASHWPASILHPWRSPEYLMKVAGPGRIVPIEVGADYRREDWSQELMDWEDFLRRIGMIAGADPSSPPAYLAQHNLLMQFPELRDDIEVPDYVYADLRSSNPNYSPPANDDQLVINAWLGPRGTVSPAHTDPYHNLYTQVVGRKTVWLAPFTFQGEMYPLSQSDDPIVSSSKPPSSTSLENTSSLDVFSTASLDDYPLFRDDVLPHSMSCVLEPGDMLFIPAGWWHGMRSEDISFSVSMWF